MQAFLNHPYAKRRHRRYGRNGKAELRSFFISQDCSSLQWKGKGGKGDVSQRVAVTVYVALHYCNTLRQALLRFLCAK
jgi:hypothetical protein